MRWPAEWEPHQAVWIGFPGDPAEWPVGREEAQREVAAFANAIANKGTGETVVLVCRTVADVDMAGTLAGAGVEIVLEPFGDIWLRDTGPIITKRRDKRNEKRENNAVRGGKFHQPAKKADSRFGELWLRDNGPALRISNEKLVAHNFRFNGWGGKYAMAGDQDIGTRLAERFHLPVSNNDWILEGGAIDGDGNGKLITTEQCILNPNRNAGITKQQVSERLGQVLAIESICWLGDGLVADHTDGHVDNLARFVAPGTVVIPKAESAEDPNADIFEDAARIVQLSGLQVVRLPSAGRYEIDGDIAPASYMNFYIGNQVVAVPQYGAANDALAVARIANLFPDRKVVGLSSQALLRGGGSFHCISQQIPLAL
jgi:agmatine deiminase|tara:strand:+ start:3809 stop:4921 length:1113 start_codon:yes stop_codon:yes gene_type:complete